MDQKSEVRFYGFTTVSTLMHIGLVVAVLTLNIQSEPKNEIELIEFQVESSPAAAAPLVEKTSEEIAAPSAPAVESNAPVEKIEKVETAKVETTKSEEGTVAEAKPVPAPVKTLPKANHAPVQAKANPPMVTQEESPVELPMMEEKLDVEAIAEKPDLNDEDIDEDLNRIDQEQASKVAALQAQMQKETEEEMAAQESKALAIKKQNQEQAAKLAKADAEKRKQEREAFAAEQAQKAAQLAAAKAAADQAARARAAEIAAANAAEEAAKNSQGNGNAAAPGMVAGDGDEVRSIEDLRQLPGNKKPEYDSEDRLNRRMGEVAFLAMVSKEGTLSQIKLLKSSGHRALDVKTLKAIKAWKFYPGQEGLVEIPMKWDLTGNVQETHGGRLRNRSSLSGG